MPFFDVFFHIGVARPSDTDVEILSDFFFILEMLKNVDQKIKKIFFCSIFFVLIQTGKSAVK